ncbi:MAG TPA: hypothetical protein VF074_03210 [Pyrinomonadaceae bacterium]
MRLSLLLFLTLNPFVGIDWAQDRPDNAKSHIPQAQPVVSWLMAVREGAEKKLKTTFSERMRKRFDETGWDEVLKTYQQAFEKEFGDYRLEDFAFEYSGGELEGKVSILYKGKKVPGVRVIKEQGEWRVDER